MALVPKQAPTFENPDDNTTPAQAAAQPAQHAQHAQPAQPAQTQTAAQATQPTQSTQTAVAIPAVHAVAVRREPLDPFISLKDAYHVDYNTLAAVQVTQGNFMDKATSASMGDRIVLELLSYQDNYVISPGVDGDQAKKLVRYSDDGVMIKDPTGVGITVQQYLQEMKNAGYGKARCDARVILVGALLDSGKLAGMQGTLVQIDLPPTSKALFERYKIQADYDIRRGRYDLPAAQLLELTAKVTKNGANQIYTLMNINRFVAPPVSAAAAATPALALAAPAA